MCIEKNTNGCYGCWVLFWPSLSCLLANIVYYWGRPCPAVSQRLQLCGVWTWCIAFVGPKTDVLQTISIRHEGLCQWCALGTPPGCEGTINAVHRLFGLNVLLHRHNLEQQAEISSCRSSCMLVQHYHIIIIASASKCRGWNCCGWKGWAAEACPQKMLVIVKFSAKQPASKN